MELNHTHRKHSVSTGITLKFLVNAPGVADRHRWILRFLCTNEHGKVCHLIGQYSEGHHEHRTFDPSRVLDPREIFSEVLQLQGSDDESDPVYLAIFADGHKPGCPMAHPEIRLDKIYEVRDKLKMTSPEAKAAACKCGKISK